VSGRPAGVAALLLDIEGTTTPLAFVTQVLFPYARMHLREHLEQHAGAERHAALLERLRREHEREERREAVPGDREERREAVPGDRVGQGGETPPPWIDTTPATRHASVVAFVNWLMDRDRKSTPLKELQGLIWESGYRRGDLVGELFSDVAPALGRWRDQGVSACIFSSGSVLAQRLLFQHSSAGDLTHLLRGFFDTEVGAKNDADSYRRISQRLGLGPDAVLFLSDVPRELDAARAAGMHARLVVRPGNAPVPAADEQAAIRSFDEL
jgi:enolase-phosphatase E1